MISIKQRRRLAVDGKPVVGLLGAVQVGLKNVGTLDLGLPKMLDGLRRPKEEEGSQEGFRVYLKGLKKKAEGLKADPPAKVSVVKGS